MAIFLIPMLMLLFSFSSMITLSSNYKSYKKTYEALSSGEYVFDYKDDDLYYYKKREDEGYKKAYGGHYSYAGNCITYFEISGDISLLNGTHLQPNFISYMDPYSVYWIIKYKKWFKKYKGISDYRVISRDSKINSILEDVV